MVVSGVYILDNKGKVLIYRNYRGDVENSEIEKFMSVSLEREDEGSLAPVIQLGSVTCSYVKYNSLYLVCLTRKNANIAMIFSFLYKLISVCLYLIIIWG